MKRQDDLLLWSFLIAIASMWGSAYLFIWLSVTMVPPFALAALRGGIGAIALAALFPIMGQRLGLSRDHLVPMVVLGMTNGWLSNVLTALAAPQIDSAKAGMINASTPLFTMLLAHVWIRQERLHTGTVLGLIVGFAGIFVLIGPEAVLGGSGTLLGHLLIIGVALCYAAGTVYGRLKKPSNPAQLALGQLVCAAIPAALVSAVLETDWHLPRQPVVILSLLALGVYCTALPAVMYWTLLRRFPATNVATVSYIIPVWAAALGVTILGEPLTWHAVVGCGVVLLGVWIANHAAGRQS
ncbi:MAG TPA: DMT family transporter [Alphaproteobacteria bacterium]|nr:DMT family transporter [Alphaproteobacteria bacterium]